MTGSRSQDVGYAVGANGPRRATCERSRSMSTNLRYLGLDVHADTIAVAMAEPSGAVRNLGVIPQSPRGRRQADPQAPGPRAAPGLLRRPAPAATSSTGSSPRLGS